MSEKSQTDRKQLVQKFGGTSLADLVGFEASADVIGRYTDQYQVIVRGAVPEAEHFPNISNMSPFFFF